MYLSLDVLLWDPMRKMRYMRRMQSYNHIGTNTINHDHLQNKIVFAFWSSMQNYFNKNLKDAILSLSTQGWGAGNFFSGSWFFFQAAPAPDFFLKRLRLLVFFFRAAPAPVFFQAAPAPRSQKHPAPQPWLSSLQNPVWGLNIVYIKSSTYI